MSSTRQHPYDSCIEYVFMHLGGFNILSLAFMFMGAGRHGQALPPLEML